MKNPTPKPEKIEKKISRVYKCNHGAPGHPKYHIEYELKEADPVLVKLDVIDYQFILVLLGELGVDELRQAMIDGTLIESDAVNKLQEKK